MRIRLMVYIIILPLFLLLTILEILTITGARLNWAFKVDGPFNVLLVLIFLGCSLVALHINIILIVVSASLLKHRNTIDNDISPFNLRLIIYIVHLIWSIIYIDSFYMPLYKAVKKGVRSEIIVMSSVMGISLLATVMYTILIIINRIRKKHSQA